MLADIFFANVSLKPLICGLDRYNIALHISLLLNELNSLVIAVNCPLQLLVIRKGSSEEVKSQHIIFF